MNLFCTNAVSVELLTCLLPKCPGGGIDEQLYGRMPRMGLRAQASRHHDKATYGIQRLAFTQPWAATNIQLTSISVDFSQFCTCSVGAYPVHCHFQAE